jgi:hypothetical protein
MLLQLPMPVARSKISETIHQVLLLPKCHERLLIQPLIIRHFCE